MSTFESAAVRSGRRVSEASVAWTIGTSTLAVLLGAAGGSLVLLAFGAVGYIDALGSVALAHHFRHGLRNLDLEDRFEQRAHRIVTVGLLVVGLTTVVTSVVRLLVGGSADPSIAASITAGVSLVVLAMLSARKRVIASRIPSSALRADGHLSAVGAMQAAVALVGIVATRRLGWNWADAVAALVVGCVAVALGVQYRRAAHA